MNRGLTSLHYVRTFNVSGTILLKMLYFLQHVFGTFVKCQMADIVWILYSVLLVYMSIFGASIILFFLLLYLCNSLESAMVIPPDSFFFSTGLFSPHSGF